MIFVQTIKTTFHLVAVVIIGLLISLSSYSRAGAMSDAASLPAGPVIYQLQTGATSSASQELVSIYNNTDQPLDITGWSVVYSSSSGNTSTELAAFTATPPNNHVVMRPYGAALLTTKEFQQAHPTIDQLTLFNAGIASTGGHISLMDKDKNLIDLLGYGSAVSPETSAKTAASTGKILQRLAVDSKVVKDTDNNSSDFFATDLLIPQSGIDHVYVEPEVIIIPPVLITEVLPNPSGSDIGQEFIELYNPNNEPINLKNYQLKLLPTSKTYALPDIVIEPNSYVALTDIETGITLPNTSAILEILNNEIVVSGMATYNDIPEDATWALSGDEWRVSYLQTPGRQNEILHAKPCSDGYARSSTTDACQKISVATTKSSTACPVGQIRNTETNRCRKIVSAVQSAVCDAGKVKNLATGRCKKLEAATAQKTCSAGQERNEQTNRCRKTVTKTDSIPEVKDVKTPMVEANTKWLAAGLAGTGSASYAAYEWRHDLRRRLEVIKSLLGGVFKK